VTPAGLVAGAGVGVGTAVLSPSIVSTLATVPWWLAAALIMAGVLCAVVRSVFPQESAHRLEWWRELWRSRYHSPSPRPRAREIGAGRPRKQPPAGQHRGDAQRKRPRRPARSRRGRPAGHPPREGMA
jgi:hypothetical protein